MTAKNLQNLKSYLEDAGFAEQTAGIFNWTNPSSPVAEPNLLPWKISQWTLESRVSNLVQISFEAQLQRAELMQNINEIFRKNYASFRKSEFHLDTQQGFWLLFDFVNPELEADQSRLIEEEGSMPEQLPHGLAGLHISLQQHMGQVSFYMTKHFFLGNVPGRMFIELPKMLSTAFFGEQLVKDVHFNAYVCMMDSEDLRRSLIRAQNLPASEDSTLDPQRFPRPFPEVRLRQGEQAWSLLWTHEGELPELVVPPIEVLEQKEVSRRFQQLDELILLENYEAAQTKCLEFLERYPSSLYLIRRLAFLTQWTGASLEQRWLELLTRFDAQNLFGLSLWIKRSLSEAPLDSLLEYLSKLGNALGQSICNFEQADITSLTLPEMLGDAWNHKDDQRAVACYERVLQTRGEIPRILVKLIRLMRDLDDPQLEEAYMDRLLACEVPIRTRAAIYFRLAEIKEKGDQEEAVQWALKSWQTNHSHVRYALLTAKLLIGLGRAHEAVHVLVETSEYLNGEETRSLRFELELKIAEIWFESLQRADLAIERLGRALELGVEDRSALLKMAELAGKLEDSALSIDIWLQLLQLAGRAADEVSVESCVAQLIKLADRIENLEQQGLIYGEVLTRSLIDPQLIEKIIANPLLTLPHAKILASLEAKIDAVREAKRGAYLQLMGDIAWRFIDDAARAQNYYEKALAEGYLNQQAFNFLDEIYSRQGLTDQRYGLLKRRFELAPAAERSVILRELYYFDEGVSESERDSYALQIFLADRDDTGPFEERISLYEHQGAVASIAALMEQLFEQGPTDLSHLPLLERAIQAIQSSSYEGRFRLIHQLLEKVETLPGDSLHRARRALQILWPDPEKAFVGRYLDMLLQENEIPEIDPDEILAVLGDHLPKVKLLVQLAGRVSENRAIGYLRRALRLSRQLTVPPELMQTMVYRLAELTILQEDELNAYIKVVRLSGQAMPILGVFGRQLLLVQDDTTRGKLAKLAAEFLAQALPADLEILREGMAALASEHEIELKVKWLAARGWEPFLHTKAFAAEALAWESTWQEREAAVSLVQKLAQEWNDPETARRLLAAQIQSLMGARNAELLNYYVEHLVDLMDFRSLLLVVEFNIRGQDLLRAERHISIALGREMHPDRIQAALLLLQQSAHEMNLGPWLQSLLGDLIDPNRTPALQQEVFKETTFFYARWLWQQEKDLRKALNYFEQIYAIDPQDSRFWGPMFLLYRRFDADTDLYELLYRTLPTLRKYPEALDEYQIELSSLEADLQKIGQTLGLTSDVTNAEQIPQFGQEPPIAIDRKGPSGTQVVHNFDQRDVSTIARSSRLPPPVQIGLNDLESESSITIAIEEMPQIKKDESSFSISQFTYKARAESPPPLVTQVSAEPLRIESLPPPFTPGNFVLPIDEDARTIQEPPAAGEQTSLLPAENINTSFDSLPPLPPPPEPMSGLTIPPAPEVPAASAFGLPQPQTELKSHLLFEPEDWRWVAAQAQAKSGLGEWLIEHPCSEKTEQHIALQVCALIEGKTELLEAWPHKVWRQPQEVFYELRWGDRMGREMFHPSSKTPLARLMRQLLPVISFQFMSQMNLRGVAERLKARPEDILRYRRPIEARDEVIQRSGLRFYTKYLQESKFSFYHLPKLDDRLQFDFERREVYFDRDYFLQAPPTHLFHRIAFLSRALHLEYYPFLVLSPINEIYPLLQRCRRMLEQNRSESVKLILGIEKDPMRIFLAQTDRDQLEALFREVGMMSADKVAKVVGAFVEQIYRLNLAETLDLIGIVESISSTNLLDQDTLPLTIIQQSPLLKAILAFCADLRFNAKA